MGTKKICPGCQKPLAPNAPDGLCPKCLIKAGLGTGVDIGPDSQGESGRTPFVAPTPEELVKPFPQLEILSFIGQGGMGAVYKARQKALDRIVALKILPPGIGKDPSFAQRFTREAKALAKLNHPGIVTLYEFGQADGLFFFLMEFVDGMNLRHLLEFGRVSPREALAIVPQICDALQCAHDQGIVHRDIKPANILVDRQGRVKVADFGLAKLVEMDAGGIPLTPSLSPSGDEGAPALTEAGKVMGTPQYMAPEQREHPTEVDHRADIYSLGVVLYQMLTGELPGKPIEPPSSRMRGIRVDVRLDEVVLRALENEPQRRYQQVSQMKSAAETVATTPPPPSGSALAPPAGASHTNTQPSADKLSPWCRIVGIALNGNFTSPLAIKLVNISALGFLGALAFLGFVPLPRMHGCFGFAGFCGLFGLIGVASIMEFSSRRKGGGSTAMQHGFIVVGRRSGKAVIHWPGVVLSFLTVLALGEGGAIIGSWVLMGRIDEVSMGIVFMGIVALTGFLIQRGRTTPVEQLTPLDGSGGVGPKPAGKEGPMPLVGIRSGRRVIHWPGLLLFAAVLVATAGATSLIFSWLLPAKGYALHPRGLVVGLVVGFILLTIKLRQAWTAPIEKLPVLDGPERSHAVWPWIGAAVGLVLLVPIALIATFGLTRDSVRVEKVETVGREAQAAHRARLAAAESLTARSGPVLERVVVGADQATLEGQGRPGFSLVLSLGDTTNRWECPFPNDTRFTAMFKGATRQGVSWQGFSWAVSDRAGKVLLATTVPQFDGDDFRQGVIVFREGTLAPEPDGSFVIAWCELGNGGLVPLAVRLEKVGKQSVQIEPIERASSAQPLAGRGAITFGPEVNGLRAAVELISSNGVFALGEPVEVLFHIRNTSSNSIYVAGGSWRQDDAHHITIEDDQGRQIPVQHIFYTVHTPIQRNLVLPGESALFHSSGLVFLARDADEKQVKQPVGNYIKVVPGRYTVRYRLHFPDLEQKDFPQTYDWQDDLDTAPVTVEVTAGKKSAAAPAFDPVIERVVVGVDQATLEGQGRSDFLLVLRLGDTTNRWECRFPNDTRFTAMFKGATRQGFSWAVSDRAVKVLFATTVPGFMGKDFNPGVIMFREGMLAPEPDGSFVIAWCELGNSGLVPLAVRLVQAPSPSQGQQAAQSLRTEGPGEVSAVARNVGDIGSNSASEAARLEWQLAQARKEEIEAKRAMADRESLLSAMENLLWRGWPIAPTTV